MAAPLKAAVASHAYLLSDRATWNAFKDKGDLQIEPEGDKRLFNQFGVILVSPVKHPNVKKDLGQRHCHVNRGWRTEWGWARLKG
jgi:tungstate transport system substrate-binding protein